MNFMKKISLFVALALVVTIGGVYAAWVYPNENAQVGTANKTYTSVMTTVEQSGTSNGALHVSTDSDNFAIRVDNDANYDGGVAWKARPVASGDFDVSFVPAAGASDSYTDGIDVQVTIAISGAQTTYTQGTTDVKIFAIKTASFVISASSFEEQTDGSFLYTFTAEDFLDCLYFCVDASTVGTTNSLVDVYLDTHAKNQTFEAALASYNFTITFSEAVGG